MSRVRPQQEARGAVTEVRPVPIRELMRNLTDSYDDYDLSTPEGWLDMLAEKASDREFPALLRARRADGQVDPSAVSDWYGRDGEPLWELGNGHHRLVAAILLGWDAVLVAFSENPTDRISGYGTSKAYDHIEEYGRPGDRAGAWELAEMIGPWAGG